MPTNRTLLIAIALTCFALIGGALYFQHVEDMLPCPFCVIQRYAFLLLGLFALVAAFARKSTPWLVLALASAVGGAAAAAKLLWVLAHPGVTCGIDPTETFLNKLPSATTMPWVFEANGLCESAGDPVMGLPIPYWSALWIGILIAALVLALVRRNK